MEKKSKKQSHQGIFKSNLAGLSVKSAEQVVQAAETEKPKPVLEVIEVAEVAEAQEKVTRNNLDTPIPVQPNSSATEEARKDTADKTITQENKNDGGVDADKAVTKKTEVTAEKKQTQTRQSGRERKNTEPIKTTRNTEGKTKRNNRTIFLVLGDSLEERFVPCHRLARMSRNDYYIAILEKEKAAYEKNRDEYVENATKKVLEEKVIPKNTEKKLSIKVSSELFDFVTEACYDIYCNKDKFIRMIFRKECERVERASKKNTHS